MPLTDQHARVLRCPVCAGGMWLDDRTVRCDLGHTSDLARQGYVHLSGTQVRRSGDTADMVQARERVQRSGIHDAIVATVAGAAAGAAAEVAPGVVVDLGAGLGHHLAAALERSPSAIGLALDSSTIACRRAAKVHDRVGAVVADVSGDVPVGDGLADVVMSVFAPRPPDEIRRILRPEGRLVVCHALAGHLSPLVESLGLLTVAEDKATQVDAALAPHLDLVSAVEIRHEAVASADQVRDMVLMGPNAFHQAAESLTEQIARLTFPLDVTIAARVATYRQV